MNVLSLFNGISAMHLALDKAQISYDTVYYAEIDKYANQVTQHHYPQDIPIGDVTKWREWDLDWVINWFGWSRDSHVRLGVLQESSWVIKMNAVCCFGQR